MRPDAPSTDGDIQMCDVCGDAQHEPQVSRRDFMKAGAIAALLPWSVSAAFAAEPPAPGASPPPNSIPPADALKRIMDGNARYAANAPNERDFSSGRAARVQAQYPIATILSCADSRVAPEFAFDQGPGDLFVLRVAGNVVNPDLLASLEYGAQFLGVPLIMVLGHTGCGAVDAAIKVLKAKAVLPGHLPGLISAIKPAVIAAEKTKTGNLLDNAAAENVRRQMARLKRSPPIVQKLYESKKIDIVGGMYDLATGKITLV
ncbi:carbonic anhydrase [Paraburkholderia nemoris]|uniref:carbonic anhydrase n=1 Tax=Paraburkholderia nemoris TaxID=2793076 RepID=UPI0038B9F612